MAMSSLKGLGPRDLRPNLTISSWNIFRAIGDPEGLGTWGPRPKL